MKKIVIEAGHGGPDPGAVNGNRKEKDDTLRLALLIQKNLAHISEIQVKLSRTADTYKTLSERTREANKWKADYYISLHRNSHTGKASGHEAWVIRTATQNTINKARIILNAIISADNLPDRGVKLGSPSYDNFAVNRDTNMASVLLEVGFISNDKDNRAFDKHIHTYAKNIAGAVCDMFGIDYFVLGDIDDDGRVTAKDARLALRFAAGLDKPTPRQVQAGDINGDGQITATDAKQILKMAAGLNLR